MVSGTGVVVVGCGVVGCGVVELVVVWAGGGGLAPSQWGSFITASSQWHMHSRLFSMEQVLIGKHLSVQTDQQLLSPGVGKHDQGMHPLA